MKGRGGAGPFLFVARLTLSGRCARLSAVLSVPGSSSQMVPFMLKRFVVLSLLIVVGLSVVGCSARKAETCDQCGSGCNRCVRRACGRDPRGDRDPQDPGDGRGDRDAGARPPRMRRRSTRRRASWFTRSPANRPAWIRKRPTMRSARWWQRSSTKGCSTWTRMARSCRPRPRRSWHRRTARPTPSPCGRA